MNTIKACFFPDQGTFFQSSKKGREDLSPQVAPLNDAILT